MKGAIPMSVEATIKQKGLFQKKFTITDILQLSGLAYGVSDENYCILPNQVAEHTLLCDTAHLARGIDVSVNKSEVHLLLSLPTTAAEIRCFYDLIAKVCEFLHTKHYDREGEKVRIQDNEHFIALDTKTSLSVLESVQSECSKNDRHFEIFGAVNPISLGPNEFAQIDGDLEKFADLLHKLQTIDARYAQPKVYDTPNGRIGVYAMEENVPIIFPITPYIVLNQIENIGAWYIFFAENQTISYSDFIENVHQVYYDANHCIVTLTPEEKDTLIQKYSVAI